MAELGIAASGVGIASLAIQVGNSIIKLKNFWDRVKEAPVEIRHIIEELETLSLVLSEIGVDDDDGEIGGVSSSSQAKCVELCEKGTNILGTIVAELEQEIGRKKWTGSFKAVLKKGMVDGLRDRLRSAQFMLMLSNQVYTDALQKQRHELQRRWAKLHNQNLVEMRSNVSRSTEVVLSMQKMQTTRPTDPDPVSKSKGDIMLIKNGQGNNGPTTVVSPLAQRTKFKNGVRKIASTHNRRRLVASIQFQSPRWLALTNHALEICGYKTPAGWDFSIQSYNVIPSDSLIFQLAGCGEVAQIQEMFDNGKASPFDQNETGLSVLDIAAYNHELEACKLLTNAGADPNVSSHKSALFMACKSGYSMDAAETSYALLDVVRFLSQETLLEDPFECEDEKMDWINFHGDGEALEWLLNESGSTYREQKLEDCVRFAIKLCGVPVQPDMASLVRVVLQGRPIDAPLCRVRDEMHKTLLHCAAWNLGELCAKPHLSSKILTWAEWDVKSEDILSDLKEHDFGIKKLMSLIKDLVRGGSKLHEVSWQEGMGTTPLLEVISGYLFSCEDPPYVRQWALGQVYTRPSAQFRVPVMAWLEQLKQSGVDLAKYGRKERRAHVKYELNKDFECLDMPDRLSDIEEFSSQHLLSFISGHKPGDWQFWMTDMMANHFVEFWDMVDHPERCIPGAWNDYFDNNGA